jgi:hypothetical protein
MAQITYADKSTMNSNSSIPAINKCQASDMNEIKSVVNSNYTELRNAIDDINIISVGLNGNKNISVSATWTYYNIPLDTIKETLGTKLTLNTTTKRIIVGSGVNYVKISTFAAIRGIRNSGEYAVRKNGSPIGVTNFQLPNTSAYFPNTIAGLIVPVSSGDYFDVTLRSAGTGTYVVAGNNNYGLTIEVIS